MEEQTTTNEAFISTLQTLVLFIGSAEEMSAGDAVEFIDNLLKMHDIVLKNIYQPKILKVVQHMIELINDLRLEKLEEIEGDRQSRVN